ncbi:MAG: YraN family protein [Bacillota bacterium]|nr:YraN family protein [Bacillota bacterium]
MVNKKDIGNFGEDIALEHLIREGYNLLARNFRSKTGEIDIILKRNNILCFVEVKTRYNDKFGSPGECINNKKKSAITRTALRYMAAERLYRFNVRFDVIEVLLNYNDNSYSINHIMSAF